MYDIYISEAHPNASMEGLDFTDIIQPTTFARKLANYELYLNDHKGYGKCKPTIPGLIDSVSNTWKRNSAYQSYYTSIWVIGKDGKFAYTVWFAHPTYPSGDPQCYTNLEKKLDSLVKPTAIMPIVMQQSVQDGSAIAACRNGIFVQNPKNRTMTLDLFSAQGKRVWSKTGPLRGLIGVRAPLPQGLYIAKLSMGNRPLHIIKAPVE